MTRKLDDMIELPKSQPKRTYKEDLECETLMVKIPSCMSFLGCTNAYDEPIGNLGKMGDEVQNPSPQSIPQVLPSFEAYTPPDDFTKRSSKRTLGILVDCSREIPSVDEPEPQLLPNFSPLDIDLGYKRGTDPPINLYSPGSFRMKVVEHLTIHTPPSPHMASFHPKAVYCYHNPCIEDPKQHYGFKPCLLGQSESLGVDFLNLEVIENNFLRGLSLPVKPNELGKRRIKETHHLEHIIQQPLFQHMAPSHHSGDENPIRTLGDYSRPSHEGYRNTIELPDGNNMVPLLSNTIRERTRLRLLQFSLRDEASNWLERLPAGSISTWEDLNTRFLAQFFPPGRTAKLRNDIMMFQHHQDESLLEAWTRFTDLLQKVPHHGIDLWLQVQIFYDHVNPARRRTIDQAAGDVPSTPDRRIIKLENQVQRLMEAHLASKSSVQVNKSTSSCEICSGPYDTQYCMEYPENPFVDYASSRTDEAGGKWFTFKPEQNTLGDTYNPSWKSHPNLRWRQPQNSQNNFSNPPNRFKPNSSFPNRSFNNNPQNFNNQLNLEGLMSSFMASQDARLSRFEADFKQQQGEITNKIDTVLKAINDRMTGVLPSDTVKNPKLNVNSTSPVLSARSYPTEDPQCSSHPLNSINAIKTYSKETNHSQKDQLQIAIKIRTQQLEEPEQTLEDE
ncbi:MAK10-like protein [Tanacetum coccineum]